MGISFKINKIWLSLAVALLLMQACSVTGNAEETGTRMVELCNDFNRLNSAIRDNRINRSRAKAEFRSLIDQIGKEYYATGRREYLSEEWVFPLQGYGYKAIGGINGNGYQKGGYDYFDGNRHSGHPSLDIFIHDKNHLSIDDVTAKPVSVLSVTGGVVVALEKEWNKSSPLRGGKYIWIYDPISNALLYYAHNSTVLVGLGDLVKPGDVISYVGRTGLNAFKRRSPTHLHLTFLPISCGLPVPRNIYKELLRSKQM